MTNPNRTSVTEMTTPASKNADPLHIPFQNTYVQLPERFYSRVSPTPVASPQLIKLNTKLALELGLEPLELASEVGVKVLAGNLTAAGSEPLAQAYAGHQFGNFVPQLGDGRANLLGEVVALNGQRYDLQLKGSGPTPFSRRGDGRAALGPVLREYLVSEAMAALGVPTTRALAAVITGQAVIREERQPGAILTRVASSHLRVGTFQYFAAREDIDGVRTLADFAIARHYPDAQQSAKPYRSLLKGVIARQSKLVAQWMMLGFIHGVMNTDNTSISGETIDYGPCAFMEAYEADKVFSSIDQQGRYAYSNQPHAMHWNLARLAEALLSLISEEEGSSEAGLEAAYAELALFAPQFDSARLAGLRRKLGLLTEREGDAALAEDLLKRMEDQHADFTLTFRQLSDAVLGNDHVRLLFSDPSAFDAWAMLWRQRMAEEETTREERVAAMQHANPAYIPRNHRIQALIDAAVQRQDFAPFEEMLAVVTRPFEDQPGMQRYAEPALPAEQVQWTFCGT